MKIVLGGWCPQEQVRLSEEEEKIAKKLGFEYEQSAFPPFDDNPWWFTHKKNKASYSIKVVRTYIKNSNVSKKEGE